MKMVSLSNIRVSFKVIEDFFNIPAFCSPSNAGNDYFVPFRRRLGRILAGGSPDPGVFCEITMLSEAASAWYDPRPRFLAQ